MQKIQRKILIRVAGVYRTTPTTALEIIAGIPLIDHLAKRRKQMYDQKDEATTKKKRKRQDSAGKDGKIIHTHKHRKVD